MMRWIRAVCSFCWQGVSLIALLSITATIPILQFASFGYMLEVSSRIARGETVRGVFRGRILPVACSLAHLHRTVLVARLVPSRHGIYRRVD